MRQATQTEAGQGFHHPMVKSLAASGGEQKGFARKPAGFGKPEPTLDPACLWSIEINTPFLADLADDRPVVSNYHHGWAEHMGVLELDPEKITRRDALLLGQSAANSAA